MGICPDCGGWIDEGDCSCSCGSTRYMDNDYGGDEGDYFNGSSTSYMPQINYKLIERLKKQMEEQEKRDKEERERKEREERLKKQRETERMFAQIERDRRMREEQKRREREENEKNPEYLVQQISRVKHQIVANRFLLISGPEHLTFIQRKIDNAFAEVIRLQGKLAQFDIDESDEYEALDEQIKTLKKENKAISYVIGHIDEAYSANAKEVLRTNTDRLNHLEEKFDSLYPKRGIFKKRDRTKRTRITLE